MSLSIFPNFADDSVIEESFFMQMKNGESLAEFSIMIVQQSAPDFTKRNPSPDDPDAIILEFSGKYENSSTPFTSSISVSGYIPAPPPEPGAVGGTAEEDPGTVTVTNIEILKYEAECDGYTASKVGDNIVITGVPVQVFTDQVYTFLMKDMKTLKNLPPDTTEDYSALIRWIPPAIKEVTINHSITLIITYDEESTALGSVPLNGVTAIVTFTIPQTVRWQYYPAVAQFRQLVAKGTI